MLPKRWIAIGAGLILAIGALSPVVANTRTPQMAADERAPERIEAATIFRANHGLRSDASYVTAAASDPTFSSDKFGLPLSAAETAEIQRRVDLQLSLGPAKRIAAVLPGYAGVFLDQLQGAEPVFLFNGDPEAQRTPILGAVPSGVTFRLVQVERSYADLLAVKEIVRENLDSVAALGIDVRTIGIDTPSNTVVIGVASADTAAATNLKKLFGDAVSVKATPSIGTDACNSVTDCWPNKGGIKIYPIISGGEPCTSGFIMKRTSPTPTRYAMLTAGHCLGLNGGTPNPPISWKHGPTANQHLVGTTAYSTWFEGEYADAGVLWIDGSSVPTTKNIFLADNSPLIQQQLTYYTPNVEQSVGDTACRMGYNSVLACGDIVDVDVDLVNVDGHHINNMIEVNFDSHVGDSGGPIFVGGAGLGTHSDSANPDCGGCHGWYTPLENSRDTLLIRYNVVFKFCLSTDCSVAGP